MKTRATKHSELPRLAGLLLAALLLSPFGNANAGTVVSSHFGFPVDLPDGWFMVGPGTIAEANADETMQSLGVPEIAAKELLQDILKKIKSGDIEFYYDREYLDREFKNHVSAQRMPPITFGSAEELKSGMDEQCRTLAEELADMFGEAVDIHSCRLAALNNRAVLHHAYTVPSQGVTIINEQIPINEKYSLGFVGGSGNDGAGLRRVRETQQSLVESLTRLLDERSL